MKKVLFFATALIALASCTNNDFVGDAPTPTSQDTQGAIVFGSGVGTPTRANHVGADAAGLLNNKFIVSGFKGNGTTMSTVFDNYIVKWATNTAGTTESNTSDWEYVGFTAEVPSAITGNQTIKYWDYSAFQYDFAAFSVGSKNLITTGTPAAGEVLISTGGITKASTYAGPTYTLTGATADLTGCYISDLVTAYEPNDYQNEVKLTFRALGAKVRVALYETIPGYSVKNVQFYQDDNTTGIGDDISANTNATLIGANFYTSGTYTISFPTIGATNNGTNSDYNKAHVTIASGATSTPTQEFGALNYVAKHDRETTTGNVFLNTSSNNATFAGTDPYYIDVLPNESGQVLELRVNYTLESVDGSGETITIHGAKAFVPSIYASWKPGYAYTYIFKISDNTNGWTNTTKADPAGLYPITFDAVVEETTENNQSTITTVATPSITTYQKGHDITKNEYDAADGDIYVQVIVDGTLKSDLADKGQLYTLSQEKTEAEVIDALTIQASTATGSITGRNGLVLTEATSVANFTKIPGEDGNNITLTTAGTAAKFTPDANTNYAYVYDATDGTPTPSYIYTAVQFAAGATKPEDWPNNYWDNPDGEGEAVATFDSSSAVTYYRRYTNTNKVYGVKVIKVVN